MLASSSRNVIKRAQHKILSATAEVNPANPIASFCLHEQRRHASGQVAHGSSSGPSPSELRRRPYAFSPDVKFRGPTHTPLARYNMMLNSQLDRGRSGIVLRIAKRMKMEGVKPDRQTYNYLLHACVQQSLYVEARAIFDDMVALGIHPDRETFHYLMLSSAVLEQQAAFDVMKMMEEWSIRPNENTYEIIITRFTENRRLELALQFLAQLPAAGLSPTLKTASAVITCAANLGFPRLAIDLADSFEATSVRRLDSDVWVDLLVSSAETLYADGTLRTWHKVVQELHVSPDEGCCLLVLHTAARYGLSGLALEVIEVLKKLNIVWCEHHIAPVVEALCHHHEIKEAFLMLDFMRKNDIRPNMETALPIVELISKDTDAIDDAWGKLEILHEEGHNIDVVALNSIIRAAVSLKDLQRAIGTYKAVSQLGVTPDIDTYNLLLEGCIAARHRDLGDRILSDMKEANVKPDVTTYERMVILCLTQSTYEDAFFYLEEMKTLGIVPPLIVYESVIRKLVSVGDTRYKLAVEELKECGYELSRKLESYISSGGAHNGFDRKDNGALPVEPVVL